MDRHYPLSLSWPLEYFLLIGPSSSIGNSMRTRVLFLPFVLLIPVLRGLVSKEHWMPVGVLRT